MSSSTGPASTPTNMVPFDAVAWTEVTLGVQREVDVWLDWPDGKGLYLGTSNAWTTEHVHVKVTVPGYGELRVWLPARDVVDREQRSRRPAFAIPRPRRRA